LFTPSHLILIAIAALIIFGPKKLPEFGRSLGTTLREFKKGANGLLQEAEAEQNNSSPNKANIIAEQKAE
ncbi:MAG TPA: twin-arginine translocase TatA/TatE family subunit, partial [Sporolactobacillaceae bacterium]|nr:twin-arginine translocase TatA/TatE family subunit [Sporolactobacillaceae bacterium]